MEIPVRIGPTAGPSRCADPQRGALSPGAQAPVHALVIPRKPVRMLVDAESADQALLGHLVLVASKVAQELGVGEGFRLVINNGESVGMTIYHLHLHIMGGRTYVEQDLAGQNKG